MSSSESPVPQRPQYNNEHLPGQIYDGDSNQQQQETPGRIIHEAEEQIRRNEEEQQFEQQQQQQQNFKEISPKENYQQQQQENNNILGKTAPAAPHPEHHQQHQAEIFHRQNPQQPPPQPFNNQEYRDHQRFQQQQQMQQHQNNLASTAPAAPPLSPLDLDKLADSRIPLPFTCSPNDQPPEVPLGLAPDPWSFGDNIIINFTSWNMAGIENIPPTEETIVRNSSNKQKTTVKVKNPIGNIHNLVTPTGHFVVYATQENGPYVGTNSVHENWENLLLKGLNRRAKRERKRLQEEFLKMQAEEEAEAKRRKQNSLFHTNNSDPSSTGGINLVDSHSGDLGSYHNVGHQNNAHSSSLTDSSNVPPPIVRTGTAKTSTLVSAAAASSSPSDNNNNVNPNVHKSFKSNHSNEIISLPHIVLDNPGSPNTMKNHLKTTKTSAVERRNSNLSSTNTNTNSRKSENSSNNNLQKQNSGSDMIDGGVNNTSQRTTHERVNDDDYDEEKEIQAEYEKRKSIFGTIPKTGSRSGENSGHLGSKQNSTLNRSAHPEDDDEQQQQPAEEIMLSGNDDNNNQQQQFFGTGANNKNQQSALIALASLDEDVPTPNNKNTSNPENNIILPTNIIQSNNNNSREGQHMKTLNPQQQNDFFHSTTGPVLENGSYSSTNFPTSAAFGASAHLMVKTSGGGSSFRINQTPKSMNSSILSGGSPHGEQLATFTPRNEDGEFVVEAANNNNNNNKRKTSIGSNNDQNTTTATSKNNTTTEEDEDLLFDDENENDDNSSSEFFCYSKIESVSMWACHIVVFARNDLKPFISRVHFSVVKTGGLNGLMGNKGGLCVEFSVDYPRPKHDRADPRRMIENSLNLEDQKEKFQQQNRPSSPKNNKSSSSSKKNKQNGGEDVTIIDGIQIRKTAKGKPVRGINFAFVCAHLAPHEHAVKERNQNVTSILQNLAVGSRGPFSSDARRPPFGVSDRLASDEFDFFMFGGDLNYRIDGQKEAIERIIHNHGNLRAVLSNNDQLLKQLRTSKDLASTFRGFREGPLTFRPTYKYEMKNSKKKDKNNNNKEKTSSPPAPPASSPLSSEMSLYDRGPKNRLPSYTDRVLYRRHFGYRYPMHLLHYYDLREIDLSDHKPVVAIVALGTPFDAEVKKHVQQATLEGVYFGNDDERGVGCFGCCGK